MKFAALLSLSLCAHATTIVAIWTPTKIVIAGDSLLNMSWTGENGVPQHKTAKDCKIRKYGSNYISAAGNYHIQTARFDVWETAARACGSSTSIDTCTAKFKTALRTALIRVAGVHDVHLSVLVAGRQNQAPALDHLTFIGTPDGRVSVKSESFRVGKQKWGRVILGERDAIDQYEHGEESKMSGSIQDEALSLVKREAHALPQEVGAPFSTLLIDESGEKWTNPGCCPASCAK